MLLVFVLCASFISNVLLEDVVNKNVTLNSTSEVIPISPPLVNVQRSRIEDSAKSKPHVSRTLRLNPKMGSENRFPSSCPQTDILLKILNLLTKSLPSSVVEPQKFKDVVSDINILLGKAPANPAFFGLHNKFKVLQNELEKILNEDKRSTIWSEPTENKLKAKISLEYDVPGKCEELLNTIINFLNNAYKENFRNCVASGKCLVNDFPQIQHGFTEQTKQPTLLEQLIKVYQSKNPYSNSNNLLNQLLTKSSVYNEYLPGLKQETKEENLYDILQNTNANKYLLSKPTIATENILSLAKPLDVSQLSNVLNGTAKVEIQKPDANYMPWQYIYPASNIPMTDSNIEEPQNLLDKKLRSKYGQTPNNSEGSINNDILNLSESLFTPNIDVATKPVENPLKVENEMVASNILNNPYYKLPISSVTPEVENLLNVKTTNKNPSIDYSRLLLLYPYLKNNVNNQAINDLLNLKYFQQTQILPNKLTEAYPKYMNTYVRPDNIYVSADKNKPHAQLSNSLQSSVTNSVKLNEVTNQNGVVELTYMLKQPKPAIEPIYYAKYKMPYVTFLYSVQDILNRNPHFRQNPKQLYDELLMNSNVTEVSDELKNLQQDELTKLISNNGTLIAAKVTQGDNEGSESQSNILQALPSTSQVPGSSYDQLSLTASQPISAPLYNSPKPLIGIQKRLVSYLPYDTQTLYQKNLFNSGSKVYNPYYSSLYGVPALKYAYLLNKNVAPLKIHNYLQSYLSGNSRVVKSV